MDSRLDETTPGFGISDPPMCAFFGQLMLPSGEVHILHRYLLEAVSIRSHPFIVNSV